MSNPMNSAAKWPTALLALFCAAAALAQEGVAPPPSTPPPARPPAGAPNSDNDEKAEPPKAADDRPEVEDDEFIPTEELQPDAAVTFPVDI
jgi:hypothetical protein